MAGQGYVKNADGGYSVNYDDERFKNVENEKTEREAQVTDTFNNMINESDKYYDNQINAAKDYAQQQSEIQQANTDFAIQQIEQQKEQTQKDYTKEQKGAYADYMKKTKSNAQNMANGGLQNTGYSESSEVSIYNTYQNRVATAKDSLNRSILNYNNSIQQAQLANNEKLAEIAYNALQMENQLSQQAFEYKNTLILQRESELERVNEFYYQRYQDVLSQINNEIELQIEIDRIEREYEQWVKEMNEKIRMNNAQIQSLQSEIDYRRAQIANINANTAYTQAQTRAVRSTTSSNNPYGSTNQLSSAGRTLLNQIQSAQKVANGKGVIGMVGAQIVTTNNIRQFLALSVSNGKISENDANIIWNTLGLN